MFGVPLSSILGPVLLNVPMCDMFLTVEDYDITNYGDNNNPYSGAVVLS